MPPVRPPLLHPPELLARIGKCLSFGCDEVQTRRAAGLVRRLAHDGATLRAAQLGALTGNGQGIVHRARIDLPKPTEGSSQPGNGSSTCISLGVTSSRQLLSGIAERLFEQKTGRPPTAEEKAVIRRGSSHLSTEDWTVDMLEPVKPRDVLSIYPWIRIQPGNNEKGQRQPVLLHAWVWSHVAMTPVAEMKCALPEKLPEGYLEILHELAGEPDPRGAAEVAAAVKALEMETWDRDDAVEDMGGA